MAAYFIPLGSNSNPEMAVEVNLNVQRSDTLLRMFKVALPWLMCLPACL